MTAKRAKTAVRNTAKTATKSTTRSAAEPRKAAGSSRSAAGKLSTGCVERARSATGRSATGSRPGKKAAPAAKAASTTRGALAKKAVSARKTPTRGVAGRRSPASKVGAGGKTQLAAKRKTAAALPGVVDVVESALDEMKAVNVKRLDVQKLTDITDTMIIASGNSDRHVRSIADRIVERAKSAGFRPSGVEGERDGEWVLVDLQDVIVHVMLPRVREFYRLESLWDVSAARREAAGQSA